MPELVQNIPTILFVGAVVTDYVIQTGQPLASSGLPGKQKYESFIKIIGGGGGNGAIAAASIARSFERPADIILASKIGGNKENDALKQHLSDCGVSLSDGVQNNKTFKSPINIAISGTDDRNIMVDPVEYPPLDSGYEDKLRALVKQADYVHIHTRLPDIALLGARLAYEEGKPVAVDASNYDKTLEKVLQYATYAVLPDELKIPCISDEKNCGENILNWIAAKGVPHAAVMCGAEDTLYSHNGTTIRIPIMTGQDFRLMDKLGAGDVARGAMMVSLAVGDNFGEALATAGVFATFSCAYQGKKWMDALENQPCLEAKQELLQSVTNYRRIPQETANIFNTTPRIEAPALEAGF